MNPYKIWKCSDFLKFFPTNSLSWDQLSYTEQNEFLNLHYGLIHNGAPTLIDCERYQLPYIQINIKNYTLCDDGDVIFADASEDTKDICKPVEFINISKNNVVCGLHTIHARDYQNLTILGYKGYLFSSYNFHKQVHRLTQGTKIFSINSSNFKEMFVGIPEKAEQKEIVLFLAKIDERIDTQSKIIKEYKTLKNAIINHLFFCNSNLDEKIKLSKFATLRNGYAFKSSDYTDNGNYNILTIANVKGDRYIYASECNKIGEIPKDIQNHQILKINDILISLTGNVGRVSLVNIDNCLLNQRVGVLSILDENYREYIFQVISSKHFENKMILKGQGAAQKNIGNDDIESFDIPFSKNHLYMNKLVNLLVSFDKKIATEEQILNDYQSQKKYLLNNMFI